MKKYSYLLLATFTLSTILFVSSCKKSDSLLTPTEMAHFTNLTSGNYTITGPGVSYKIPIGVTTISNESRTVNISVSSPTGAVEGTHFTLSTKSLTIPAGKAIDTLIVQGNFAQYQSGRKDTLIFTLSESGAKPSDYNRTFTLAMRGPCSESEIITDFAVALPGTYKTLETAFNANGTTAYANSGPYNTVVKNVTSVSATTVLITVANIYGVTGWEAKFTLDFSDLTNRKVTTTSQRLGSGSPLGLPAYDIFVEAPSATQNLPSYGNFSFCQNTINLKFRLGARDPASGTLAGFLTEQSGGGTATYVMSMTK